MKVRRISDELCKENGLSVIEPKRGSRGYEYTFLDEDPPEGYTFTPKKKRKAKYRCIFLYHTTLKSAFSLNELRAMYFDYLHRMGARSAGRRIEPTDNLALKSDVDKLNARIRQMRYLSRTGFETVGQLRTCISELQQQTQPLLSQRKKLYRKPENEAAITKINEQLRPIWAEIFLCRDIEKQSEDIHKKLSDMRKAKRQTNIAAQKHSILNTSQYYDNIIS